MKSSYLKKKIGGAILMLSLLFGIGMATSLTTQAQWRNDDQYRRQRDYEREQRRRQREWEREQRRRQREQARDGYYNNDGYYGNNGGYNNGGYYGRTNDGYPNLGGTFQLRQTALNAGYNNGIEEGRRDRQRGERFEYRDESDYQRATEDYNSRYGDRGLYMQYFRMAFARGYEAGYNGY